MAYDVDGTNWKLSVADNGIGKPDGVFAQTKTGLGTGIIKALAQNLNAIGNVTLWQDHLYLDVRAAAGVGSTSGSMPGLGYGTTSSGQPNSGITGLTKQNSTQYTSFAVSPYFLQQFDTYGTLKLGYTLSHTTTSNAGGFVPLPTNSTGTSASQTTNEEFAR